MAATLAVATLGLLGAGPGAARPDPPAAAQPQYDRAAQPIVESRGRRLRAAPGSTCWRKLRPDGSGVGYCADATAPKTKRRLRVRSYGVVNIDMGMPANDLTASLDGGPALTRLRRLDADGRHWRLRLPQRFAERTVLYLFGRYAQGDASFGASLRHVKRPPG